MDALVLIGSFVLLMLVGMPVAWWQRWCRVRERPVRQAAELAAHLGQAPSLVMRANGAVTVGPNIELATGFAWCLEDAARIETLVRSMVDVAERDDACLTAEEIDARQVSSGAVFERLWDYLTADDPESLGSGAAFPVPQWGRP